MRIYEIIHAEEGKTGYLVKLRITNIGSGTCVLQFLLLTSKGGRGFLGTGIEKLVFTRLNATAEQRALIEKCLEEPEDVIRYMISWYPAVIGAEVLPKDTKEVWLLYGLEPDEVPIKINTIAVCVAGKRIETYVIEIPLLVITEGSH